MPTKRKPIGRRFNAPVSDEIIHLLRTGDLPAVGGANWLDAFLKARDPFTTRGRDAGLQADWLAVRVDLLAEWMEEAPGTRPYGWWTFDAPRWQGPYPPRCDRLVWYLQEIAEPRRRVGGVGT